jgi:hypothetical protein
VEPTNRATLSKSNAGASSMLEVRADNDGFVVFDTEADEPVMRFDDRREADQLVAELQVQELNAQLERFSPDRAQPIY